MLEGLDFETIGQGKFVEFGGDGFSPERINVAPNGKINIGTRAVIAFGAGTEELGLGDLGMTMKNLAYESQFVRCECRGVHLRFS